MQVLIVSRQRIRVSKFGYIHRQDANKWSFGVAKKIAKIHKIDKQLTIGNEMILDRLRSIVNEQKGTGEPVQERSLFIKLSRILDIPREVIIGQFGLSSLDDTSII